MRVVWQGDHKLLGETGEKEDFERELKRLGYDPNQFLVEVRREPDAPAADGLSAIRYKLYITELGTDKETLVLEGGHGKAWLAQFAQYAINRTRGLSRK